MNAVFFGEELHKRCPAIMGALCRDDGQWIGFPDVLTAMQAGETITIRPANENERKRAEALVQASEISAQLGAKVCEVFGNQGDDVVEDVVFNLHQALMSAEFPALQLLDKD